MSIGAKLKELRVCKGLTQEELADRAELSKGFISQLERDLTSPSIATLMDILQCLGTSIGEFFNEAPEEQIVFGKQDYFEKNDAEYKNNIKWIIPNAQKNTPMKEKRSAMYFPVRFPSIWEIRSTRQKRGNPSTTGPIKPIFSPAKTALP